MEERGVGAVFGREDRTFQEIRERSLKEWLDEMEVHEDVNVRGGVRLAKEYVAYLKEQVAFLEEKNKLKDEYLKRLAQRAKEKE